ncbi:MAG: YceH family protein [Acidimicrobiia bacterium]|nr:YceH family protein [Acidimicrobiia bacterium]MDH4306912.1 YceH family protein [Acidimicrobiia bacterium]MDH5292910.1 YceH family protein [Acidimicrobiia bacterium]
MIELDAAEARVLGCLIEKQMTTPEYYPMTVNSLVAAASQKTNRDPVVAYDEELVEGALASLNDKQLSRFTRSPGARTLKYVHKAGDVLEVDAQQLAVLAIMLLRGPQTPGELRARTERYCHFTDVEAIESVLTDLITRDNPLVERLDREPGQKESRYRTLLVAWDPSAVPKSHPAPVRSDLEDRIAALEARVQRLESELGL